MRPEDPVTSYHEIVKHNFYTHQEIEIVGQPVKGRAAAERLVQALGDRLSSEEKAAGVACYLRRTSSRPSLKPHRRLPSRKSRLTSRPGGRK